MESPPGRTRTLFKHSIIYGIGLFLKKAIGFFLIPLYTHQFTHAQYGKLAILYLYSGALIIFFQLGLNDAFFKQFTEKNYDAKDVYSRFFFFRLFYTSLFLIFFLLFSRAISGILLNFEDGFLIQLATLTIWIESLSTPSLLTLRIKNLSKMFVTVNTIRFILNCGFNILFVLYLKMGVGGVMFGNLLSGFLFFFLLYPVLQNNLIKNFNWKPIKDLLKYGLPLLPLSFLLLGLDLGDRWIIKMISGLGATGIYTLGYQFGAVMGVLVYGFRISWISFFFNNPEKKETFAHSTIIFIRLCLILWGMLSLFTKEIFKLMVAPEFFSAIPIVPVIAFSYILLGLEEIFTAGFFIKSRTSMLFPIVLLSFILNIILNFILIPYIGIMGAAVATLLSFFIFTIISYYVVQKFFPVKYNFRVIFIDLFIGILFFFIPFIYNNHFILRILSFIFLCIFIAWEEKTNIRKLIKGFIMY